MAVVFDEYFQTLFHSMHPALSSVDYCFQKIPKRVTDVMNAMLPKKFDLEEVKQALDQMAPLKSPRPDGFSPIFIKFIGMWWAPRFALGSYPFSMMANSIQG